MRSPGAGGGRDGRTPVRTGSTLLEVVVAAALSSVLLLGIGAILFRVERVVRTAVERIEWLAAAALAEDRIDRIAHGGGVEGGARSSASGLAHRAWRGSAAWCGDGWIEFAVRDPDPARDSLWWVDGDGAVRVERLVARSPGGCGGAGVQLGVVDPADPARTDWLASGVVRWFEPGRIRIEDAVRYGRDGSPAQPLTPEVFGSGTGLGITGTALEWTATSAPAAGGGAAESVRRRWPVGGGT